MTTYIVYNTINATHASEAHAPNLACVIPDSGYLDNY